MYWNYRILATEHEGDYYFSINEVYYDKNNNPTAYSEKQLLSWIDSKKDIRWILKNAKSALDKPILFSGDKFPQIFKK